MAKHKGMGVCAICGNRKRMSTEDAYPDWLRKQSHARGPYRTTLNGVAEDEWNPTIVMRHQKFCHECNNRVGRFNEGAIPIVESMMRGAEVELDTNAQEVVAGWCYRTLVSVDLYSNDPDMPSTDAHNLAHADVPDHIRLWLGDFNFELPDSVTPRTPLNTDYGRIILRGNYGPLMTFQRLVVMMVGGSDPEILTAENPAEQRGHVVPIWPTTSETVRWPPRWRHNKRTLDDLGRLFAREGPAR